MSCHPSSDAHQTTVDFHVHNRSGRYAWGLARNLPDVRDCFRFGFDCGLAAVQGLIHKNGLGAESVPPSLVHYTRTSTAVDRSWVDRGWDVFCFIFCQVITEGRTSKSLFRSRPFCSKLLILHKQLTDLRFLKPEFSKEARLRWSPPKNKPMQSLVMQNVEVYSVLCLQKNRVALHDSPDHIFFSRSQNEQKWIYRRLVFLHRTFVCSSSVDPQDLGKDSNQSGSTKPLHVFHDRGLKLISRHIRSLDGRARHRRKYRIKYLADARSLC